MAFKKHEPNVWHYEKDGDAVQGHLVEIEKNAVYPEKQVYELRKDDGTSVLIFGTTVLDSKMRGIRVGDYVRVTYKGSKENKGKNATKMFEIEKDEERTLPQSVE